MAQNLSDCGIFFLSFFFLLYCSAVWCIIHFDPRCHSVSDELQLPTYPLIYTHIHIHIHVHTATLRKHTCKCQMSDSKSTILAFLITNLYALLLRSLYLFLIFVNCVWKFIFKTIAFKISLSRFRVSVAAVITSRNFSVQLFL